MKENNKKKTIAVVLMVFAIVAVISVTYAFITQTLTGSKKVTITAGTLSLVLNEGNAITISDALPMYDQNNQDQNQNDQNKDNQDQNQDKDQNDQDQQNDQNKEAEGKPE